MKFSLKMSPRVGRLEDGLAGDGPMSGRQLYERSFCRSQSN